METIGYGFLLGIGIVTAVIAFAAAVVLVTVICMFISYMVGRNRKRRGDDGARMRDGRREGL